MYGRETVRRGKMSMGRMTDQKRVTAYEAS